MTASVTTTAVAAGIGGATASVMPSTVRAAHHYDRRDAAVITCFTGQRRACLQVGCAFTENYHPEHPQHGCDIRPRSVSVQCAEHRATFGVRVCIRHQLLVTLTKIGAEFFLIVMAEHPAAMIENQRRQDDAGSFC